MGTNGKATVSQISPKGADPSAQDYEPPDLAPTLSATYRPLNMPQIVQSLGRDRNDGQELPSECLGLSAGSSKNLQNPGLRRGYKIVKEIWDPVTKEYKRLEDTPKEGGASKEYAFILHRLSGKPGADPRDHFVVRSGELQDILRRALEDTQDFSLVENKLTVDRKLLFGHLSKLEGLLTIAATPSQDSIEDSDTPSSGYLLILVELLKDLYVSDVITLGRNIV
ncbi:MAG: hypothetical protein M1839_005358 [Geoglossum umbratile]|nr:MAG: hypothetical protein M1839_005358 [Geoglossum umbratile]